MKYTLSCHPHIYLLFVYVLSDTFGTSVQVDFTHTGWRGGLKKPHWTFGVHKGRSLTQPQSCLEITRERGACKQRRRALGLAVLSPSQVRHANRVRSRRPSGICCRTVVPPLESQLSPTLVRAPSVADRLGHFYRETQRLERLAIFCTLCGCSRKSCKITRRKRMIHSGRTRLEVSHGRLEVPPVVISPSEVCFQCCHCREREQLIPFRPETFTSFVCLFLFVFCFRLQTRATEARTGRELFRVVDGAPNLNLTCQLKSRNFSLFLSLPNQFYLQSTCFSPFHLLWYLFWVFWLIGGRWCLVVGVFDRVKCWIKLLLFDFAIHFRDA